MTDSKCCDNDIKLAGLMKGEMNFILFDSEDELLELLKELGHKVEKDKILGEDGKQIMCPHCDKGLTLSNLGNIFPGSPSYYCDAPDSILHYLTTVVEEAIIEEAAK